MSVLALLVALAPSMAASPGVSSPLASSGSPAIVWLDIDADGLLDPVRYRPGAPAQFYRNAGNGGFEIAGLPWNALTKPVNVIRAEDLDGDGQKELIVATAEETAVLRIGAVGPNFQAELPGAGNVDLLDYDLDGLLDLVLDGRIFRQADGSMFAEIALPDIAHRVILPTEDVALRASTYPQDVSPHQAPGEQGGKGLGSDAPCTTPECVAQADARFLNADEAEVDGAEVVDGSLTAADLGANAVGVEEIQSGAVGTAAIADEAVTTAKLAPGTQVADADRLDGLDASQFLRADQSTSLQAPSPNLWITDTAWNQSLRMGADQFGAFIEPGQAASALRVNANANTDGIYLDGRNGNIGVGSTAPLAKLSVKGSLLAGIGGDDHVGGVEKIHLAGLRDQPTMIALSQYGQHSMWLAAGVNNALVSDAGDFSFRVLGDFLSSDPSSSGREVLHLTESGLVGVGTSTPASLLTVNGETQLTLDNPAGGPSEISGLRLAASGTPKWSIDSRNGNDFVGQGDDLWISSGGNTPEVMIDREGGKVGIGISSPSATLDVAGDLNARQIADVQIVQGFSSSAINQAIQSLPSTGGKVYLPAGTYEISEKILLPDRVTLEGAGRSTVLQNLSFTGDMIANRLDRAGPGRDIIIRDLVLDGNSSTGEKGIQISDPYRCLIENVVIRHFKNGMMLRAVNEANGAPAVDSYTTVRNVQLEDIQGDEAHGKGFLTKLVRYVHYMGCSARQCGVQGFWSSGAEVVTVSNCQAIECGAGGFWTSYDSNRWAFSACIARGNGESGFTFTVTENCHISLSACESYDNEYDGFRLDGGNIALQGCVAKNNGQNGIRLRAKDSPVDDVTISGCVLNDNGRNGSGYSGIDLADEGNPVSNIVITGNRAEGHTYGISSHGSDISYVTIVANNTRGNTDGIAVTSNGLQEGFNFE